MKEIVLFLIKIYQKTLSLDHGWMGKVFPNLRYCRFTPSCSEYSYQAVEKYGAIRGGWMGFKRVLRCGPWTPVGTYDPVR